MERLSTATTAHVQAPGGWFLNNAGWVAGSERTLLVDTCATEARSRHLLGAVRSASRAPISAVLTHAHGDHANGAGLVVRGGGTVAATATAAAEIAAGPHTLPELFRYDGWGDIDPPAGLETVTGTTDLDLGGVSAQVVPVPSAAHTGGDLVVWCPDEGVLFTGDLLFHGVTPLALQGSVLGWLDALAWLERFSARTLVPGHGPVVTPQEGLLDAVREYLRWLVDVTGPARPDFDRLQRRARELWPRWIDAERHAANLRLAHAEQHGEPFDQVTAALAMRDSAGGPIQLDL